jgi:hypothetical protein
MYHIDLSVRVPQDENILGGTAACLVSQKTKRTAGMINYLVPGGNNPCEDLEVTMVAPPYEPNVTKNRERHWSSTFLHLHYETIIYS